MSPLRGLRRKRFPLPAATGWLLRDLGLTSDVSKPEALVECIKLAVGPRTDVLRAPCCKPKVTHVGRRDVKALKEAAAPMQGEQLGRWWPCSSAA